MDQSGIKDNLLTWISKFFPVKKQQLLNCLIHRTFLLILASSQWALLKLLESFHHANVIARRVSLAGRFYNKSQWKLPKEIYAEVSRREPKDVTIATTTGLVKLQFHWLYLFIVFPFELQCHTKLYQLQEYNTVIHNF